MKHHIHTSLKLAVLILSSAIFFLEKKPNLIVIMTDDQGYHDVGFNGSKEIPTPHIDSIAANGVKFTDGYVSFPVCGPSRAGFITGRYQDRFGFTTNQPKTPRTNCWFAAFRKHDGRYFKNCRVQISSSWKMASRNTSKISPA